MNITSHVEKIRRLDDLRCQLDPGAHFELWFWATMNAGTHAVNAALHAAGITDASDYYPMQPGVYLVKGETGRYEPQFRPLGDVLHVGRPRIEAIVPSPLAEMMSAMEMIERYRDPCIRGSQEPTSQVIAECSAAYDVCVRQATGAFNLAIG